MEFYPQAYLRALLLFLLYSLLPAGAQAEVAGTSIHACSDTAEWPPYSFRGGASRERVIGISVDLLQEIFSHRGLTLQMELLPWKRCLQYVARGQYQVVTDASRSPQRERDYLISEPAYRLTQALFYDRRRFPDGLPELTAESITRYRLGGIAGYNYDLTDYDLTDNPSVIDSERLNIDTSVDSYADLLELLRRGRLDFAIGTPEVLANLEYNRKLSLQGIGQVPIPGSEPLWFHYLLPRNEQGEELKRIIDRGLQTLRANGCYQRILARYGVGS